MKADILFSAALCIFSAGVAIAAPAQGPKAEIPEPLLDLMNKDVNKGTGKNVYQIQNPYSYQPLTPAGQEFMKAITTAVYKLDKLYDSAIPLDLVRLGDPEYAKLIEGRERDIAAFETISNSITEVYNNQKDIVENPRAYGENLSRDELADRGAVVGYLRAYFDLPLDNSVHGRLLYEHFLKKDQANYEDVKKATEEYLAADESEKKKLIAEEPNLANPMAFLRAATLNLWISENEAWLRGSRRDDEFAETKIDDRRVAMVKVKEIIQWYKELSATERELAASVNALQRNDDLTEEDFRKFETTIWRLFFSSFPRFYFLQCDSY